jgi:hypothetical protein
VRVHTLTLSYTPGRCGVTPRLPLGPQSCKPLYLGREPKARIATLRLDQLLKITTNFKKYMWQKLKLEKPNIATKVILKPNVATVMETHFEVDIATIEESNQMVVLRE